MKRKDDYALFASPSNKKKPKKAFKGCCGYCGEFGHKAADYPNKKSNQNKGQKAKTSIRKDRVLKETLRAKDMQICQKLSAIIVGNVDFLPEIPQKHTAMLILLKKVSKTRKWKICWIWMVLVYVKNMR